MANVTDYFEQLLKLTLKNLEILNTLNLAFTSNETHLNLKLGDVNYSVPSFMYLESQLNKLNENFYNLVHAPETGEAYFNFDGNSRSIEIRGYQTAPNNIDLNKTDIFYNEPNNFFDSLITPLIYVNFNLKELPEDITSVVVKRITPLTNDLINSFKEICMDRPTTSKKYNELITKELFNKKINIDYKETEEVVKLPIRSNICTGIYVVESIEKEQVSLNSEKLIFKIRTTNLSNEYCKNFTLKTIDNTIEKSLEIGDELTTYDGKTKLKITNINLENSEIEVEVSNGEYLNIEGCGPDVEEKYINDTSKLKFYRKYNYGLNKDVKINILSNQYTYITIAALNDRMNIRSSWGNGIIINPYSLKNTQNESLYDFYNKNASHIGNTLREITSLLFHNITDVTKDDFNILTKAKPNGADIHTKVLQVNTHLNKTPVIEEILKLSSQKQIYVLNLKEINAEISKYQDLIFNSGNNSNRTHLNELRQKELDRKNYILAINNITNEIHRLSVESNIPIENAKYRIRGYFDYKNFVNSIQSINNYSEKNILGIKVIYRYKNPLKPNEPTSIDEDFIFSEWNTSKDYIRPRHPEYNNGYVFESEDGNNNEPTFNQIDIPITPGELVDIKVKVIYDYGYPFIQTTSSWSDILTIQFPEELIHTIKILDIIQQNEDDIEKNKFNNIIESYDIPDHTGDGINEKNHKYFHKSENITSGFFDENNSIISLKDKLTDMNDKLDSLTAEISEDPAKKLNVQLVLDKTIYTLKPFNKNKIEVASYSSVISNNKYNNYFIEDDKVCVDMYLNITNKLYANTNYKTSQGILNNILQENPTVKIYSLFPGNNNVKLQQTYYSRFKKEDYAVIGDDTLGVWMKCQQPHLTVQQGPQVKTSSSANISLSQLTEFAELLTQNQLVTFRLNDIFTGDPYYEDSDKTWLVNNKLPLNSKINLPKDTLGATFYPYLSDSNSIKLSDNSIYSYKLLNNESSITIPLRFEYNLKPSALLAIINVSKTISFDIRTSLYTEPINYTIQITAASNKLTPSTFTPSSTVQFYKK